jgi:hypothetical protein
MEFVTLSSKELVETKPGEALTLAAVVAVMAVALLAILCYRLFKSSGGGTVKMPGGWAFTWE